MKFRYAFENPQYGFDDDPSKSLGEKWKKKIFDAVIGSIVSAIYPRGVSGMETRCYNRILIALDTTDDDYIHIDKADGEFLKKLLTHPEAKVMPPQVRIFCVLQDEVDNAFRDNESSRDAKAH